ncbi:MAG TPA: carboxypeptidase-like regulatory domain-containing protein, partial [Bryobacteraceae bacterium]
MPSPTLEAQGQPATYSAGGVVRDQSGGPLVGVQALIRDHSGAVHNLTTDSDGGFNLSGLRAGAYSLRIIARGFDPIERDFRLGPLSPRARFTVVLKIETLKQVITVEGGAISVAFDPTTGAGTEILTERELESLPDDPDRFAEQLQIIAASAGGAPGNAVVTVDGFLHGGRLPPKS